MDTTDAHLNVLDVGIFTLLDDLHSLDSDARDLRPTLRDSSILNNTSLEYSLYNHANGLQTVNGSIESASKGQGTRVKVLR
jgi:hypothetical protein